VLYRLHLATLSGLEFCPSWSEFQRQKGKAREEGRQFFDTLFLAAATFSHPSAAIYQSASSYFLASGGREASSPSCNALIRYVLESQERRACGKKGLPANGQKEMAPLNYN
jgi:hypothetical protein